jgi:molybdopterin converting factor small subunit
MNIVVQLFGPLAEQAGRSKVEVTTSGNTVGDVVAALGFKIDRSVRFAVNTDYASPEAVVREGDTVSLIPPVGGG